jgi:23S rRNA (guanosine2251-2'-O)-methyltransferase
MSDIPPQRRDQTTARQHRSGRQGFRPPTAAREPRSARIWLYGTHAVAAALANPGRRWHRLAVLAGHEEEARRLVNEARAIRLGKDEAVRVLNHIGFTLILPVSAVHQGIALEVDPLAERYLDDVLPSTVEAAARSIILVLDRISDPQNIGAVLRSAAAFGALAVVVPARGTPSITGALAKAASGAVEIVPLVRAVNLARALDRLKANGFWICGLDETASLPLARVKVGERIAVVLGSEGGGIRRLVRERCDLLARLPTRPEQPTLNVSNAAAVALYELVRGGTS